MITEDILEALDRTALLIQRDFYPDLTTEQIVTGLTNMHVRIVSDETNLANAAAQTFVITAAIALTQTGAQLTLNLPAIPLCGAQPPLHGPNLGAALVEHLRQLPTSLPIP